MTLYNNLINLTFPLHKIRIYFKWYDSLNIIYDYLKLVLVYLDLFAFSILFFITWILYYVLFL